MDRRERWKLATHLNVYQIALLMAGFDPVEFTTHSTERWSKEVTKETTPYLEAVMNAVLEKRVRFTEITSEWGISWAETRVELDSFRNWLTSRNFRDGFFVAAAAEADPLFTASSEVYAPKLAAAVRAWRDVTADPDALNGKTPKQALEIWLRKHAAEYDLLDKEGNPIKQALEDICKVANWRPEGGAARTPTRQGKIGGPEMGDALQGANPSTPPLATHPPLRGNPPSRQPSPDFDDEIPF